MVLQYPDNRYTNVKITSYIDGVDEIQKILYAPHDSMNLTEIEFTIDVATQSGDISGGIAFTSRPTALRGYYKYSPVGPDTAIAAVTFV